RVLSAEIPPLASIRQEALAEELGISKIPVREALARLEQSGFLRSLPNRGFFVAALTRIEAEEVFALRLKLEPDAAADACEVADDAQRGLATVALRELEAAEGGSKVTMMVRNRHFLPQLARSREMQVTGTT